MGEKPREKSQKKAEEKHQEKAESKKGWRVKEKSYKELINWIRVEIQRQLTEEQVETDATIKLHFYSKNFPNQDNAEKNGAKIQK